jgi:hypothetical protein
LVAESHGTSCNMSRPRAGTNLPGRAFRVMKLPTLRPEIFLTLFVFAGIYKAFPLLALPLGLDWTAVMGIVTLLAFLLLFLLEGSVVRTGWSTPDVWLLLLTLVVCIGVLHSSDPTYGLEIASEYLLLGVLAS